MIRAAATMRIKWLIANIQGSSHGIYGKYHSLLPEKHPYFHSTSSFVSSLHYLMLRQKQQPPSWFVAPHLTFPAPFWVIPGCTSRTIFLRNHSIKSLFRPLVVSHCPTNKVTASHPGVQSPLKSDTCLSFHAVHHGFCTPALPFQLWATVTPLTSLPLFAHSLMPENLPHPPASSHSVKISSILCDIINFVPFLNLLPLVIANRRTIL